MKHLKHLLFALPMLLIAMSFAGCNTEEVDPVIPELEIAEELTGEALESLTLQFDATESSKTFAVRCNRAWTAVSSNADWCVVNPDEGDGDNTLTVTVSRNTGSTRKAEIIVSTILFKRSIYIEQKGEQADAKVIFADNLDGEAASQDSNGKWPYANEFQKFNKKGTGAAEVTYDSKSVTVRSNSPSNDTKYNNSDYTKNEASGVNNLYFAAGGTFTINKIALDGETKLHMEWGVERNEYGNYDAPFNPAEFKLSLSADSVKWTEITYTRSDYSAWDKASTDFTLKEAAQYLYIKMEASIATRVDDINLTTGAGGQEVDLAAGSEGQDPTDPSDPTVDGTKLYYESFDGVVLSANTKLDAFETAGGFVRQGLGGAGATYTGTTFDFRKSHASESYAGASGGNNAFGNKADVVFVVNNINVGNAQNIDLSMGLRVFTAYNAAEFEAYYTTDGGATYKPLSLTRDAGEGWKITTASFTVAENESIVGLKFVSKVAEQQFRIDDLTLSTKDEGVKIEAVPVVKTAEATDITMSGATIGGSYEFDGTISEAGVAYKAEGAADYTVEKALAIQSPFSITLNTLNDGTNYEYYAYVVVDGKEYKGDVKTFATEKDTSVAVTYFADDFAAIENNKVYTSGKWTFTSTDAGWPANAYLGWFGKTYSDGSKYINVAPYSSSMSEVVAYAVMTKFNVADAEGKKLTFDLAWYFKTKDNSKFEVVASKDYSGDVATATWEVVESYTYTDETINPMNTWTSYSLDLSTKYASEKALAVAFRYTGKSNTYRLDNVEFGAAEVPVEVLTVVTGEATDVTATSATLAGSYSGVTEAPAEVGVEYRMNGVADYTKVAASAVAESFSVEVAELVEESTYEYRAYAVKGEETTYGEVKTFTTAAAEEEDPTTPIASVELNGTYTVKGVVTALSARGFILTDESGSIFYYNASYKANYVVGQELTVTGKISQYNKGLQIDGTSATIVEGEVVGYEYPTPATADAAAIDAFIANTANRFATYVELTGDLEISGNYYNVTVAGTKNMGSIYYPTNDIKSALATGTNITIKGYAIAVSGGKYYNMVVSEATTNYVIPKITPASTSMSFVAEGEAKTNELTVAGQGELLLFANSSDEHFTATIEGTTLTVTAAENTTTEAKSATVTVYMAASADAEAVVSAEIACSQAAPSTGDDGGDDSEKTEQVVYTTGFESSEGFKATTTYNNAAAAAFGAAGSQWKTVYGTAATTDAISGSQSMQMRWYSSAATTFGYTYTDFDIANVTKVEFAAAMTGKNSVKVSYSTDGGATWQGEQTFTLTTSKATYTYVVSETGLANVRLKFQLVIPSSSPVNKSRLYIDDVKVSGMQ